MKFMLLSFFLLFSLQGKGLSVQLLNDELYDTDEDLTGGFKVLYQYNDNWSFRIGQDIYTPKDTDLLTPTLGDRPYNAWLYAGLSYQKDLFDIDTLLTFSLDIGTRGPRALGKEVQNGIHDLVNVDYANGWDSQTKNEYGNLVTFIAEKLLTDLSFNTDKDLISLSSYALVETGTIWRTYSAGLSLNFGYNTPDYHTIINFPDGNSFYLFGSIEGIIVDRNGLLEGNSNYNVTKERFIRKYDIGFNWDIDNVRLRFTGVTITKEFTTQTVAHRFGLVEITVAF